MDTLKDLIKVVSKQAIKRVEVMGNSTNYSSKMRDLYDGIAEGRFESDAAAAAELYDSDENNSSYKKIKYRLEQRLINTTFFIDLNKPRYTDESKAALSCYRSMYSAQLLKYLGMRKASVKIAKRALSQSIKYEFSNISYRLCSLLRNYYGNIIGDIKKMEYYHEQTMSYLQLVYYENIAESNQAKISAYSRSTKADINEIEKLLIRYTDELSEILKNAHSLTLFRFYHVLNTRRYYLINDYVNLKKASEEALNYLNKKHINPQNFTTFYLYILVACIHLKKYEEGEKTIEKVLQLKPTQITFFSIKEYHTLLSFHANKLQQAYFIIASTVDNKALIREMPPIIREHWRLYEAYASLFVKMGKINPDNSSYKLKRFKLARFLNEVPIFSSEKRVANIPVLIIQILFFLQQKQFSKVTDRMNALNAYTYRYLRKDETFRSNVFIKMILQIPKAHFHKEAVIRKTESLRHKLDNVPLEATRKSAEIEIIPYENLWGFVLEMLDNRFHYV